VPRFHETQLLITTIYIYIYIYIYILERAHLILARTEDRVQSSAEEYCTCLNFGLVIYSFHRSYQLYSNSSVL
jgi:hypothetical protein